MIAALSAAGLPSDRFTFEGFLPAKKGTRQNTLAALKNEERTLIFYEAPHRIAETLVDMAEVFGADREVAMAREISKTFETIRSDAVAELAAWVAADKNQQRGEIVLVVHGAPARDNSALEAESERVMGILLEELSVKQAAALGAKLTGQKKKVLYQWALDNREA